MPKVKTNRGATKRFKITGKGKIRRYKAYATHLLTNKSRKKKRSLRQSSLIASVDQSRIKRLISA